MASILEKYTSEFAAGRELVSEESEPLLDALISEADESAVANLLTAWNAKGLEENEIYEFARTLRSRMKRVNSRHETFVDIVGTGGSKAKTFNVSTAAAFVVAGAGVPVAKHGNKAATSNSGSADVLAELGINSAVDPETAEHCLNEIGLCFMFAPNHHRLSPTLAKVRRRLGFPTIFNCVGPLCNPASAPHQLIGVWDKDLLPKMAGALARLGTKKSWIVNGDDGLDEISIRTTTSVIEVEGTSLRAFSLSPIDCGLKEQSLDELNINLDGAEKSAWAIKAILTNRWPGAMESIVLVNSIAALYLGGKVTSLAEGFAYALESIGKGYAERKLQEMGEAIPA